MAKRLTVTPFPKDMNAVFEHLLAYAKHKSRTIAIQTCGVLYVLDNPQSYNEYPMSIARVSGLMVSEIADIIDSPNRALMLIKYEDDNDGAEEDGEVSEP